MDEVVGLTGTETSRVASLIDHYGHTVSDITDFTAVGGRALLVPSSLSPAEICVVVRDYHNNARGLYCHLSSPVTRLCPSMESILLWDRSE